MNLLCPVKLSHSLNSLENDVQVQKFHVLAISRAEVNADDGIGVGDNDEDVHAIGRRPSNKVDNWDYIFTETADNVQVS